jgi:hypothetical protein
MSIVVYILSFAVAALGLLKGHFEGLVFLPSAVIAVKAQLRLRQLEKRLNEDRRLPSSPSDAETVDWVPVRSGDDALCPEVALVGTR